MRKILLCALFVVGSYFFIAPQNALAGGCSGYFYYVSIVGYNTAQNNVFGYQGMALDYYLGICFDPEISGVLDPICSENGEGDLDYDEDIGFADWIPAEVFLFSNNYQPNTYYTSLGDFFLRRWYNGQRIYRGYSGVCIRTPPLCTPLGENGTPPPCPTPSVTPPPSPSPTPPTVQVQEVGFTGNYTLKRWDDYPLEVVISNPTWVRNANNNDKNPVAYTKGTNPTVTTKLTINPATSRSINALVRMKVGGNVATTQNTSVTLSGSTVNLNNIAVNAEKLESQPKLKKGIYNFDWEISFDDGQNWRSIGTSGGHIIYWTFGDVVEPTNCKNDSLRRNCLFVNNYGDMEYPGLYDEALEKAIGELNKLLEPPNEVTQTPDEIAKALAKNIDHDIVYNPARNQQDEDHPLKAYNFRTLGVQCSVNANLLRGLLRSIGINNSEAVYIWGGKPNNTNRQENETGGLTYAYRVVSVSPGTGTSSSYYYSFQAIRPASDEGSVVLQKDPHFTFHTMVKIWDGTNEGTNNLNARYYDPSYAKRLQSNPSRYPDYPYINNNLVFRKVANLDNHDTNPKSDKFVKDDETRPFIVRALRLNSCLPNDQTCDPNLTKKTKKTLSEFVAAMPKTSVFDAQGTSTFTVWRPSDGVWYSSNGYTNSQLYGQFGISGDKLAPGDYDGDGVTDYAVFRPANNTWYIWQSDSQTALSIQWGLASDKLVSGDFDGDEKNDIAVYRPMDGAWYVRRSSDGSMLAVTFGSSEDKPVSVDFDGDGKTDIAVYRPSNGTWYWLRSSDGGFNATTFGISEDKPTPGDYDGDGKTDLAIWRPSTRDWWIRQSSDESVRVINLGIVGDIPLPGDYDGDVKTDAAVWTPSTGRWMVINSDDGTTTEAYWGGQSLGDIPVGAAFIY